VAGSLPGALKRLGANVSVGLPLYRSVREGSFQRQIVLKGLQVPLADRTLVGNVHATETEDGVPVYFFEREDLFDRPNLYRTAEGTTTTISNGSLFSAAPRFCLHEPQA